MNDFKSKYLATLLVSISLLTGCDDDSDHQDTSTPTPTITKFNFVEGTIAQMQTAILDGGTTCHQVVQGYLDRINAYDKQGPTLNSIITINAQALAEADKLDEYFKINKKLIGPLHCVTVLPKDNIDTSDMPTSAGSKALMNSQPEQNAFIINNIKQAGAIIIGKANLDEFAFSYQGDGTHPNGGQVKNAYDLAKGPGGSSSGTGAAIAASLAMVGIGTDTGGSIRIPSSVEALYGLRPSLRLISQSGIIPLSPFQDTAGPMCRNVEDCALLMNSMVGYDAYGSSNQRTSIDIDAINIGNATAYQFMTNVPNDYKVSLDTNGLRGARIGVVRALFSSADTDEAKIVNQAMESAISQLKAAGAIVEDVTIDDLSTILTKYTSMSAFQFKSSLTTYLQSWSNAKDHHYLSYDEILASGEARSNFGIYNIDLTSSAMQAAYQLNAYERPNYVRTRLNNALNNLSADGTAKGQGYDVLLYPTMQGLPSVVGGTPNAGTNNRLSPFSGFPAMNLPAAMVNQSDSNIKLPVGMEILGREFNEPVLFKIAYAWQQYAHIRQAPIHTPELVH
ncbi:MULTISPECIES: amidase [Acinetobacter]|uniref:amidase n=1 Tax=Acinetobacter TaxID=469 RepID=UPI00084C9D9C|nr:amidase family protein [Acinetobacter sp. YK3]OEC89970.1 hypothetical protein A9Z07_05295 [Acinetobacter sp. YK3]